MLQGIAGYWIEAVAPTFFVQELTTDPFPPGTDVYANIALSSVNTLFEGNGPDPTFAAEAFVESFTFYESDGRESWTEPGTDFRQNAVFVRSCARITFALVAERVWAIAQVNIVTVV